MDLWLLYFFNQTATHPVLDVLMIGLTTVGLAILPGLGIAFLTNKHQRRMGLAVWLTLATTLGATLIFQYLASRPRPEDVRLLIPAPDLPAYPSGHTAAAFGVAVVIGLFYKRGYGWGIPLLGAGLIAFSRVYLGHHYPSDLVGGAVLGASLGAACYGLVGKPHINWRWLLWPQIALTIVVSQMAYLGFLPFHLMRWPLADKVMHFLLFGAIAFWLNLWLKGRTVQMWAWAIPVAVLLPLTIALVEEGIQSFSPLRSADITDLVSDLAGMLFFWGLSYKFIKPCHKPKKPIQAG